MAKKKIYQCMECQYKSDGGEDGKIFIQFSNKKVLCEECIDAVTHRLLKKRLELIGE